MTNSGNIVMKVDNIIKSENDKCLYRGLELSNRMKIMLVSDPDTDESAAAIEINVGYSSEPDYMPGLAHLCELMLITGSDKYPNEDDYIKFIKEHEGWRYAKTACDHTRHMFRIDKPTGLKGALDRFSQFFLHPHFTEAAMNKSIMEVDKKFKQKLKYDGPNINQLKQHLSDPNHPYHKFANGNNETLKIIPHQKSINLRDELFKFYDMWYSSNVITLAVFGKETLDQLEEIVVELFSGVIDKNVERPIWKESPYEGERLKTRTFVTPITNEQYMEVIFSSPHAAKSAAHNYISHLIHCTGPGSLMFELDKKGYSYHLSSSYNSPNRSIVFFNISMDLTEHGLNHTDEIIKMIFQYLNMIKQVSPLQWFHEEICNSIRRNFKFHDVYALTHVENIARDLQNYPFEEVLCKSDLLKWNPHAIKKLLNDFIPKNIRVFIVAKKFENITVMKEPWYGTNYKSEVIEHKAMKDWENAGLHDNFKMPEKNIFIPENLELRCNDPDITEHPIIIKDTALIRTWFKQYNKLLEPKVCMTLEFVSPLAYLCPSNVCKTKMLLEIFRDSLNCYKSCTKLADSGVYINESNRGFTVDIDGYTDKQDALLKIIMDEFINLKIEPKKFNFHKQEHISWLNRMSGCDLTVHYLEALIQEHSWSKLELINATEQLSVDEMKTFITSFQSNMHVECLICGNANKEEALVFSQIVEEKLSSINNMLPPLSNQLLLGRELQLEDGCNYLYEAQTSIDDQSHVEVYYQCGLENIEIKTLLNLFDELARNVLREYGEEPSAYEEYYFNVRRNSGIIGLWVNASSTEHPLLMDHKIEKFLRSMHKHLMEMSEDDFVKTKDEIVARKLREYDEDLSSVEFDYWLEISSQLYVFNRENAEIAQNAACRRKIAIHVISTAEKGAGTLPRPNVEENNQQIILNIADFKSSHEMYDYVQPYINTSRKEWK